MSDNQQSNNKDLASFNEAEKIRQQLHELPIQHDNPNISDKTNNPNGQDAAKGLAASMQIVSGVIVAGFLGYGFDYIFHTMPFAMVIMIPIGMIAGFRNMIRSLDSDTNNPRKSE